MTKLLKSSSGVRDLHYNRDLIDDDIKNYISSCDRFHQSIIWGQCVLGLKVPVERPIHHVLFSVYGRVAVKIADTRIRRVRRVWER